MSEHSTYSITEVVGTSPDSIATAMRNGVKKVSETVHHIDWVEVTSIRGQLNDGTVAHFQVQMKVGFRIE